MTHNAQYKYILHVDHKKKIVRLKFGDAFSFAGQSVLFDIVSYTGTDSLSTHINNVSNLRPFVHKKGVKFTLTIQFNGNDIDLETEIEILKFLSFFSFFFSR